MWHFICKGRENLQEEENLSRLRSEMGKERITKEARRTRRKLRERQVFFIRDREFLLSTT
jgi:hypothetical protein